MKKVLKTLLVLAGASLGIWLADVTIDLTQQHFTLFSDPENWWIRFAAYGIGVVVCGVIALIFSEGWASAIVKSVTRVEKGIAKASPKLLVLSVAGLGTGLLTGFLMSMIVSQLGEGLFVVCINLCVYIICVYLCMAVARRIGRDRAAGEAAEQTAADAGEKFVDTSVLIDGRILDICKTGILEGTLVVPEFVLGELQHIADSEDALRRGKGRRGLDILQKLRTGLSEVDLQVEVRAVELQEEEAVDTALLRAAKQKGGKVLTLDYNLNKVAAVQQVPVINLNELSNAVKPLLLPGEELTVCILRKGREREQGIAYLPDGTMIVVEDARHRVGEEFVVAVTSVLQTAAGRMIFAKPV